MGDGSLRPLRPEPAGNIRQNDQGPTWACEQHRHRDQRPACACPGGIVDGSAIIARPSRLSRAFAPSCDLSPLSRRYVRGCESNRAGEPQARRFASPNLPAMCPQARALRSAPSERNEETEPCPASASRPLAPPSFSAAASYCSGCSAWSAGAGPCRCSQSSAPPNAAPRHRPQAPYEARRRRKHCDGRLAGRPSGASCPGSARRRDPGRRAPAGRRLAARTRPGGVSSTTSSPSTTVPSGSRPGASATAGKRAVRPLPFRLSSGARPCCTTAMQRQPSHFGSNVSKTILRSRAADDGIAVDIHSTSGAGAPSHC